MKRISEGKFVVTGEVEPVKTTDLTEVLEAARRLKDCCVAVNVTDNPTAFAYMNALIPSYMIQKEVGLEAVYQMVTRDRNRLALLSDLLAAGALGIKNILALTGDSVVVGDNPQAKPVHDLDSTQFIYMIRKIVDEGVDLAGKKIHNPPKFHVGAAVNPNADPLEPEVYKLLRKQNVGVDFIQTQSVYDIEVVKRFFDLAKSIGVKVPILVGVTPFKSIKMLEWIVKFVPGITVPTEIQERLYKAREKSKETFVEENLEIFSEFCKEIKKTTSAAGIHMMAIGFEEIVPKILDRAGIQI
jgi:methylenetetrahydrofolate reductase (NADPH)